MNTQPVISVIVITYKSEEFILETLNSAKAQTYQNIELIISDDNSPDNTIAVCEKWIEKNKDRFVRTEIIRSAKNTGTSANLNRGLSAATGDWVKFIAGDDYLYPDCLEAFLTVANTNPEIEFLFSNMTTNGVESENTGLIQFFSLSKEQQYHTLLKNNILPAPATLIKRETVKRINGFDERFQLLDDYPFFLKALKSGIRFFHIDKPLVFYRVHETNISQQQKLNLNYTKDIKEFFKKIYFRELIRNRLFLHFSHYSLQYILLQLAALGVVTKLKTYNSILNWLSPLNWKLRFQKRLTWK